MIYILTGAVRTGKTTALLNWISGRQDADGVLCPDGEHGKRYFLQLRPQQKFNLEATENQPQQECISVGRFSFLKNAFTRANNYIISIAREEKYTWLIIDELGKLELKHTGLHQAAKTVIDRHRSNKNIHIILVVRSTLLQDIITHYNITHYECITKEELEQLG